MAIVTESREVFYWMTIVGSRQVWLCRSMRTHCSAMFVIPQKELPLMQHTRFNVTSLGRDPVQQTGTAAPGKGCLASIIRGLKRKKKTQAGWYMS